MSWHVPSPHVYATSPRGRSHRCRARAPKWRASSLTMPRTAHHSVNCYAVLLRLVATPNRCKHTHTQHTDALALRHSLNDGALPSARRTLFNPFLTLLPARNGTHTHNLDNPATSLRYHPAILKSSSSPPLPRCHPTPATARRVARRADDPCASPAIDELFDTMVLRSPFSPLTHSHLLTSRALRGRCRRHTHFVPPRPFPVPRAPRLARRARCLPPSFL